LKVRLDFQLSFMRGAWFHPSCGRAGPGSSAHP
jgi:hypothetical protein